MELNDQDGQWNAARDTRQEEEVVCAERVRIVKAQRICCLEHGVQTVVLLDVQGTLAGVKLELSIELDLEGAEAIGQKFLEIRELKS